jgi:catabolite repression HPr-like protein
VLPADAHEFAAENVASQRKFGAGNALISVSIESNNSGQGCPGQQNRRNIHQPQHHYSSIGGYNIMVKKTIRIGLASGLEARPVAMLVQIASSFESVIHIETQNKRVNAKSIMGMMTLCLGNGEEITAIVEGTDEETAMKEIETYLQGTI